MNFRLLFLISGGFLNLALGHDVLDPRLTGKYALSRYYRPMIKIDKDFDLQDLRPLVLLNGTRLKIESNGPIYFDKNTQAYIHESHVSVKYEYIIGGGTFTCIFPAREEIRFANQSDKSPIRIMLTRPSEFPLVEGKCPETYSMSKEFRTLLRVD